MYARDDFSGFWGIVVRARKSLSLYLFSLCFSLFFFLTNSFFSLEGFFFEILGFRHS